MKLESQDGFLMKKLPPLLFKRFSPMAGNNNRGCGLREPTWELLQQPSGSSSEWSTPSRSATERCRACQPAPTNNTRCKFHSNTEGASWRCVQKKTAAANQQTMSCRQQIAASLCPSLLVACHRMNSEEVRALIRPDSEQPAGDVDETTAVFLMQRCI